MSTTRIQFSTREQWLADRAQDITSTEIAALYGLSPYCTEFELWHQKAEGFTVPFSENDRMKWGTRLQDAIAIGVAEDMGWEASRLDDYMRDEDARIGSSFDFEVVCRERGPGLMEIKNVDRSIFYEKWIDEPTGIEAPQHIELQAQHQMEVADMGWCAIVALVGGNDAKVTIRDRDRAIGRDIRKRVAAFWESVATGTPPAPNYETDADFLCKLHGRADKGTQIDAPSDVAALLADYADLGKIEGDAAKKRKAIKAQVLERIGTASKVTSPIGALSCSETQPSQGTLITPEMVGTYVGARAGFRQFRFTPAKAKK